MIAATVEGVDLNRAAPKVINSASNLVAGGVPSVENLAFSVASKASSDLKVTPTLRQ